MTCSQNRINPDWPNLKKKKKFFKEPSNSFNPSSFPICPSKFRRSFKSAQTSLTTNIYPDRGPHKSMSPQTGQWIQNWARTKVSGNTPSIHRKCKNALGQTLLPVQHQKESILLKAWRLYCLLGWSCHMTAIVYRTLCHTLLSVTYSAHQYILEISTEDSCFLLLSAILQMRKKKLWKLCSLPLTLATGFKALISYCSLERAPGLEVLVPVLPLPWCPCVTLGKSMFSSLNSTELGTD